MKEKLDLWMYYHPNFRKTIMGLKIVLLISLFGTSSLLAESSSKASLDLNTLLNEESFISKVEVIDLTSDIQQQLIVSGTVIDEKTGESMPSVHVVVKGTKIGVLTDGNGQFSITIPDPNAVLVVSFVGYITQEITLAGQKLINVSMVQSIEALQEVVVIGYGSEDKKDLTGSVSSILSEKILDKPVLTVGQALQGKVAGLKVIEMGGLPGSSSLIRIRGTGSINSSNDPLFVVDGIVGLKDAVSTLNPSLIQSITVLKDASATAIYGARGANGVIIVTTKRGQAGEPVVEYNGYVSAGMTTRRLQLLDADEAMYVFHQGWHTALKYMGGKTPNYSRDFRAATASGKSYSELGHLFEQVNQGDYFLDLQGKDGNYYKPRFNTDWWEEAYRTTLSFNHQLSIQGGSENAKFGLFAGVSNEQGLVKGNDYKRYSLKLTGDMDFLKRIDLSTSLTYYYTEDEQAYQGSINRVIMEAWPFLPVKYPDDPAIYGDYAGKWANDQDFPQGYRWDTPAAVIELAEDTYTKNKITGDVGLSIRITKDLNFKSTFAVDAVSRKNNFYLSRLLSYSSFNGNASISTYFGLDWQNENYFNYSKQLGDHMISGILGLSWSRYSIENFSGSNSIFFDDFYGWHNIGMGTAIRPVPSSSDASNSLNSYFARATYNYKSKYLLTITGRYDGSSKFGEKTKYGFFPSGAVAWRLSEEEFVKNINAISDLKLRVSVGQTGNQEIGNYVTQTFIGSGSVIFGGQAIKGLYQTSQGNSDLKWEKTTQYNGGLDVSLFSNRVSLIFDYYYKLTTDMLLQVPLPPSTTMGSVMKNYGSVSNKGIEIQLNTVNIDHSNLKWYTDLVFSRNRNKILKLGPTGADIMQNYWEGTYHSILRVGEPIGSFWGLTRLGTWGTKEASEAVRYGMLPGDIKWKDLNEDGVIDVNNDLSIIGNAWPKWEADINNTITFKNFDFNIEFRFCIGFMKEDFTMLIAEDVANAGGAKNSVLDGWTPYHQNTMVPEVRAKQGGVYYYHLGDTRWVQDASFIRGEGATIGYTFPRSINNKIGTQSLRAYMNVKNFSLYCPGWQGVEPEGGNYVSDGLTPNRDFYGYPRPTTFSFGVNVVF